MTEDRGIRGTWRSPLAQPFGPVSAVQRGTFIQYGQATVGSVGAGLEVTTAVTFEKMFANTSYRVYLTTAQTTNSYQIFNRSNSKAKTGFNIITSNSGGAATDILVDWIAVGIGA